MASNSKKNPEYNPDWQSIYDRRAALYQEANREIDRLRHASADVQDAARNRATELHQSMLDTFRMQHETIEEYAQWMFRTFTIHADQNMKQLILPDFTKFETLDEVSEEWNEISRLADKLKAIATKSLKADQTGIFSNETVSSYARVFASGHREISTLVTTEIEGNKLRVCFMHDPEHRGLAPTNAIEYLADTIYREARQLSAPQNLRERFAGKRAVDPSQFEFYIHVPPECAPREMFARVDMSYQSGNFVFPKWEHLTTIPEKIQSARFEAEKTVNKAQMRQITHAPGPQ